MRCFLFSFFLVFLSATASSWLQYHFDKSTLDAVYITFQAYTTIGFGDIEQFDPFHTTTTFLSLATVIVLLRVVGIVLVATLINSFVRYKIEREKIKTMIKEKLRHGSLILSEKAKKLVRIGTENVSCEEEDDQTQDHLEEANEP